MAESVVYPDGSGHKDGKFIKDALKASGVKFNANGENVIIFADGDIMTFGEKSGEISIGNAISKILFRLTQMERRLSSHGKTLEEHGKKLSRRM